MKITPTASCIDSLLPGKIPHTIEDVFFVFFFVHKIPIMFRMNFENDL